MPSLNILCTVYNEASFLPYALKACVPYAKSVTIVEGAYQETMKLGVSPRSTDGTIDIARSFANQYDNVHLLHANEQSDLHQRNIGLAHIKKLDPNGWLLICDGDEIYEPVTFKLIEAACSKMQYANALAAYFKSLTFVNDLKHYCIQEFPRLFRITPECKFVNDNFMAWQGQQWLSPYVIKLPNIQFFHYSFCKGATRFSLKKSWWETRFGEPFNYSWTIGGDNKIYDPDHSIMEYNGQHPLVMHSHPLYERNRES